MNFIEAIKSGKLFRRQGWESYHCASGMSVCPPFSYEDVIATDWEIKPEPKKKEKRWLWSDEKGEISRFFHSQRPPVFGIRLDWSEQEFEVDS